MRRRPRPLAWFAALIVASAWSAPASANLVLSFESSSYATTVGNTVAVRVFVTQVAGGPQVGAGNELVTASIELSFATGKAAVVASPGAVAYGSAWDQGFTSTRTSGAFTLYDVSLASINGIANLSSPLLLATFTFTGLTAGAQVVQVSQQDPNSADFGTFGGDIVDPTNTATANISVGPLATVPEPGSLFLASLAAAVIAPAARRGRVALRRG